MTDREMKVWCVEQAFRTPPNVIHSPEDVMRMAQSIYEWVSGQSDATGKRHS